MGLRSQLDEASVTVHPRARAFVSQPGWMLCDGERRAAPRAVVNVDPSTSAPLGRVASASPADVDLAVRSARRGFEGRWRSAAPGERAEILESVALAVERNADELAQIESLDVGRPITRSLHVDVPSVAASFRYFAGLAAGLAEERRATGHADASLAVRREPIGLIAVITPWNLAMMLFAWNVAPALAAGCAVVVKPAELAALSALRMGELLLEAGLPPGVVNVCPGGVATGAALVAHPGVDAVAFTGSTETGRRVAAAVAEASPRPLTLELGGKNANIVLADADLSRAIPDAVFAAFANAGQACSAGSRLLIQRPVYDAVLDGVARAAGELVAGPSLDPGTTLGPLISAAHLERVRGHVARAIDQGARPVAVDMPLPAGLNGFYMPPTVLVDVDDGMPCAREEIFGPVLTVQPFDEPSEAVMRANAPGFGLTAGIWTRAPRVAERMAAGLRVGTVWINGYHRYDPAAPFGGRGLSGYGRRCGPEALESCLQTKSVWTVPGTGRRDPGVPG